MMLCAFIYSGKAQKIIEKHMSFAQKSKVVLNIQITDSIKINTWNKNEVYAKASVNINDNKDNDAYITSFDESGNEIKIDVHIKSESMDKNNCCMNDQIIWEIFIPENASFSVETINGNIVILGKTSEIKAHTISGFVDLTVPKTKKADLTFKTISGTIYSNHEFVFNDTKHTYMPKISQKINGGGSAINLETISGDIFFREM